MARIPSKTIKGNSAQLLNSVRNELGGSYAEHVPVALQEGDTVNGETVSRADALKRLREIGSILDTYPLHRNAFLDALINRIGRVILSSRLYSNPWAFFKRGYLEYGETVEELFVSICEAKQFNSEDDGSNPFSQEKPDVRAAFHQLNYQKFYKTTVNEPMLHTAFLSYDGISDLVSKIIEALYTSANFDEFLMMRYLIAKNILNGNMYPLVIPTLTVANSEQIVIDLKNISEQLTFMSSDYNAAGVPTYSDKSSQYFILNTEFLATIDVAVLARAFNLDKVEFMARTVSVNSFTFSGLDESRLINLLYPDSATKPTSLFTDAEKAILASVPGVLVDRDWFMIFDNFEAMRQIENPEKLYWNYFYHVWKTFSTSPFASALVLTTTEPSVTAVTVSPATATVVKGGTLQLTAAVTGTGIVSHAVTWSVNSNLSKISPSGQLQVAAEETATSLTVTATSVADSSVSGTATITISGTTGAVEDTASN